MKNALVLLAAFSLLACTSMTSGVLYDRSGNPLPETLVRLITIDDRGNERIELDETVTDDYGYFRFDLSNDTNGSIVLVANLIDGPIRGFYAGRTGLIPVHPLTETLYTLVTDIASSPDGRSLSDFSAAELREIADTLFAWDWAAIPYTDTDRLEETARVAAGRKIALAAGGTISARTTSALEGSENTSDMTFVQGGGICPFGEEIHLLDGASFRFDVEKDGTLCGDTSSTLSPIFYNKAFRMLLPSDLFFTYSGSVFPDPITPLAALEGDREIALGPYALAVPLSDPRQEDTLTVSRKVYVPADSDVVRYLEIFRNSGSADRAVDLEITAYLTTTNYSTILTYDAETVALSELSRFFSVYDFAQDRPTAGFIFQDGLGSFPLTMLAAPEIAGGELNEIRYTWSRFHIPAGSTRTFVHYGFLTSSRFHSDVYDSMLDLVERPDMTGMNREELATLMNFTPNRGTITGDAGAVVGKATVTGSNSRTGELVTFSARRDGSFALPIDAASGDTIAVTASDGLDTTLTVP